MKREHSRGKHIQRAREGRHTQSERSRSKRIKSKRSKRQEDDAAGQTQGAGKGSRKGTVEKRCRVVRIIFGGPADSKVLFHVRVLDKQGF